MGKDTAAYVDNSVDDEDIRSEPLSRVRKAVMGCLNGSLMTAKLKCIQLGTETTDSLEDDADTSHNEKLKDLHHIN